MLDQSQPEIGLRMDEVWSYFESDLGKLPEVAKVGVRKG
jgi:hypothetical protein